MLKRKKNKILTIIQQTNNTILTSSQRVIYDLCRVINWLFIIWFWLVKKTPAF